MRTRLAEKAHATGGTHATWKPHIQAKTHIPAKTHVTAGFHGGFIWYCGTRKFAFGACAVSTSLREICRRDYTLADAEALAAWLNEREAGYPVHEALMPNTAADQ